MVDLKEKKECSGCRACEQICPQKAIKMVEDSHGFIYPEIDKVHCTECGLCDKICSFTDGNYDLLLHESLKIYGAKINDDIVRANSTSGGVFTAISDFVLKKNGAIYGSVLDENMTIMHKRAIDEEDRNKMRGSKYAQSDTADSFKNAKQDLISGKMVLYSGTPCQIAGLKKYLAKEYENLITIDVVCHGVPSNKIFKEFIEIVQNDTKAKVKSFNFRGKTNGWRSSQPEITYQTEPKKKFSNLYSYHELFYKNIMLRPSCINCKFMYEKRTSDFTIADYWGIWNRRPDLNDNKGISMVLLNSSKAIELFDEVKDNLDFFESDFEDRKYQGRLTGVNTYSSNIDKFWSQYDKHGFRYVLKLYTDYSVIHKYKIKIIRRLKMCFGRN